MMPSVDSAGRIPKDRFVVRIVESSNLAGSERVTDIWVGRCHISVRHFDHWCLGPPRNPPLLSEEVVFRRCLLAPSCCLPLCSHGPALCVHLRHVP